MTNSKNLDKKKNNNVYYSLSRHNRCMQMKWNLLTVLTTQLLRHSMQMKWNLLKCTYDSIITSQHANEVKFTNCTYDSIITS